MEENNMIKSALEIAMEKTKSLQVDKEAIAVQEARMEGKKLAGSFLNDPGEKDLAELIKAYPKEKQEHIKTGIFEVLLANLQLPVSISASASGAGSSVNNARIQAITEGLSAIAGKTAAAQLQTVAPQINTFLKQYTEDMQQADEAIDRKSVV